MAEDWTARGSLPGLDIEIRGGHADRGEYLVLALKGTPDLDRALAGLAPLLLPLTPWPMPWLAVNPFQPWLEFWRAAWAPWFAVANALAAPPQRPRQERP